MQDGRAEQKEQYRRPALTVDGVIMLCQSRFLSDRIPLVLLIERGREPFKGMFALPGGFVDYGEDLDDAINREIAEETGLSGLPLRQFRAYGHPRRDPRGHTVSVVYYAEIIGEPPQVVAGDDAAAADWFPLDGLPSLAFDHALILAQIREALRIR